MIAVSYHNPPIPWRELEGRISGRPAPHGHQESHADQVGYRHVRKPFDRHPVRPEGPVVPMPNCTAIPLTVSLTALPIPKISSFGR
ncbi:error-prone repair homolog of DNA polymerase III [Cutibacterium acnes JCM 18918]|nr:error-prone repair homolog of DNA polymerase III [Cutibacterium acnes JCM 18918]